MFYCKKEQKNKTKKTENILDANIQITYFNPSLAVLANSVDPRSVGF